MRTRSQAKPDRAKALKTSEALAGILDTAPAQKTPWNGELPKPGRGLAKVVDSLYAHDFDPEQEAKAIKESLTVKEALTPTNLEQALNRAEEMARRAHRYYVVALADYELFKAKLEPIEDAMRSEALDKLQLEKLKGGRSKTITEADVRCRMATMYPDQWAEVVQLKARYDGAIEHWKKIAELAANRCYSLNGLLAKKRNG